MKGTFLLDKYEGSVDLFKYDRKDANCLAIGKNKAIAKLFELIANEVDSMNNGETLYITFEKE